MSDGKEKTMPPVLHLVLLVLAFVLGAVATVIAGPGFTWQRSLSAAFTALVASMISW